MPDPYLLPADDPVVLQISGGRSSAYMLRQILDAYGGALPENAIPIFQNTGKERMETLDFLHEIETRWGVPLVWLEYRYDSNARGRKHGEFKNTYAIVDYATASRRGEPFEQLIDQIRRVPCAIRRICTADLKLATVRRYMKRTMKTAHFYAVIGLRADEPHRVHRAHPISHKIERLYPMYHAGATRKTIDDYWAASCFDLQLKGEEGNCDLCFLKGDRKIIKILRERPDLADWWIRVEERMVDRNGPRLRKPGIAQFKRHITYAELLRIAQTSPEQGELDLPQEESLDCNCTD